MRHKQAGRQAKSHKQAGWQMAKHTGSQAVQQSNPKHELINLVIILLK